jgi:hypothetical protein
MRSFYHEKFDLYSMCGFVRVTSTKRYITTFILEYLECWNMEMNNKDVLQSS